jgi:predicted MPP superfamily phosphohydrolase
MADQINKVRDLQPDILINTGDFVTFGWREFNNFDTILSKASGKYGTYAVMGNHDFGTYQSFFTEADRENNVLRINQLAKSSGYRVLNDEHEIISINGAKIGLIGVTTKGRHPDIIHGDLDKALMDLDSVDFQILLSHDPNFWEMAVAGKTDINLTLSGHTHGMQMGVYTKKFRWSPSKYFYPHWSGLYEKDGQYLYVNRGLGVLAIPFRIWMPPEITLIILRKE